MSLNENTTGRMGIGVVSAGKVGCVLASALRASGHQIIGAYAPDDNSSERLEAMLPGVPNLDPVILVERSELVILAVPDESIASVVSSLADKHAWQSGQIVLHTSPLYGIDVLSPAQKLGALCLAVHPAMEFSGTSLDLARLARCSFAITAPAPLQPIGHALVAEMGGESIVIAEKDRLHYAQILDAAERDTCSAIKTAMLALSSLGIDRPGAFLSSLIGDIVDRELNRYTDR